MASLLVTNTYGKASRGPLGVYNFAGDLGKAVFPAVVALLLTVVAWRPVVGMMAVVSLAAAVALLALVPQTPFMAPAERQSTVSRGSGKGFGLLFAIGALDTATRMGYLLFLPFLLHARGGKEAAVGLGLALLFMGGALGKAASGWLGQAAPLTSQRRSGVAFGAPVQTRCSSPICETSEYVSREKTWLTSVTIFWRALSLSSSYLTARMLTDWQIELNFPIGNDWPQRPAFALEQFDQAETLHSFQRARQIGFCATGQGFEFGQGLRLLLDNEIKQQPVFIRQHAGKAFDRSEPQFWLIGARLQFAARDCQRARFHVRIRRNANS
jgi:hypothetical protein